MVEVFDLHQAEHKTIHYAARIEDFNHPILGVVTGEENYIMGSRKNRRFLWVYRRGVEQR